jgi:5-(carboxyamino)imidazole ribonucleotide synthase
MASIPPGAWLGLLGGGQLGRMFCMAAQSLGYKVVVLDPGAHSPAGSVADRHIEADYLDAPALAELARLAAAATTEFENVPAAALEFLARNARVTPAAASVAIAQDRISEKMFLSGHGFAVAPFEVLRSAEDAGAVRADLVPGIVKSARFGYDGKGQVRVGSREEVAPATKGAKVRMMGTKRAKTTALPPCLAKKAWVRSKWLCLRKRIRPLKARCPN